MQDREGPPGPIIMEEHQIIQDQRLIDATSNLRQTITDNFRLWQKPGSGDHARWLEWCQMQVKHHAPNSTVSLIPFEFLETRILTNPLREIVIQKGLATVNSLATCTIDNQQKEILEKSKKGRLLLALKEVAEAKIAAY